MTSHDLCIIHLSDLHFANGIYRSVFDNLINDIRRQVREDEDIAILVTGDLVSQGAIASNKDELVKFFEGLASALPKSSHLHVLEIVPGNHDGQRKLINDSNGIQHFDLDLREFEDVVKLVRQRFESTCHLPARSCVHATMAIDFYGRHIVFCTLNTSFFEQPIRAREIIEEELKKDGTYGAGNVDRLFTQYKEDLRRKIDAQCKDICRQCQDDRAAHGRCAPDLTIITAHHPLSVLNISGYEQAEDALFKRNLEFGDLWISGHVHFSQHYFTSDNTKQRIMLTTGIGWQDSQRELLRYSIYRVNLDRNTCQVSHRFSTSNDDFKPDGTTGTNEEFSLYKHFTLPLRLNSVGATIHANSSSEVHARGFYVDVSAVEMLPRMLSEMRVAQRHLCKLIDSYGEEVRGCHKNGLSGGFLHRLFAAHREELPITMAKIRKRLRKKKTFVSLADSICREFACVLQRVALLKLAEDKNGSVDDAGMIEWRVHWRRYQCCRSKIITRWQDVYVAQKAFGSDGNEVRNPSDQKWEGLICAAMSKKLPSLINSANPTVNEHHTDWSDFMTIVPSSPKFIISYGGKDRRPLLTFGISFKTEDPILMKVGTKVLYLLEYLNIGGVIDGVLLDFVEKYGFSATDIARDI